MRDGVAIVSALLAVLVPGRSARRAGSYRRAGLLDHGDRAWRCTWTPPTTGGCGYASIQDHTTHQQALVQISSVRLSTALATPTAGPGSRWPTARAPAGDYDRDMIGLATCYVGHWYRVDYRLMPSSKICGSNRR
jgi:hypothetical protein